MKTYKILLTFIKFLAYFNQCFNLIIIFAELKCLISRNSIMAYPFNPADREIFKKTFLRDVVIFMSYAPIDDRDSFVNGLVPFISEKFEKAVNKEEIKAGIGIISEDKYVSFYFSDDKTMLRMRYPAYKSFDMAVHWLPLLKEYLNTIGVSKSLAVTISKFNELNFEMQKDNPIDVNAAMHAIFSNNLLENAAFNNADSRCEKDKVLVDEDSHTYIRLTYGFKKDDVKENKGSLIFKSAITYEFSGIEEITDIKLRELNDLLDGAFQWSVNDAVILNMRQG